jgi:hypothetical protein
LAIVADAARGGIAFDEAILDVPQREGPRHVD